jgi:hypothetical protein
MKDFDRRSNSKTDSINRFNFFKPARLPSSGKIAAKQDRSLAR